MVYGNSMVDEAVTLRCPVNILSRSLNSLTWLARVFSPDFSSILVRWTPSFRHLPGILWNRTAQNGKREFEACQEMANKLSSEVYFENFEKWGEFWKYEGSFGKFPKNK